MGFEGPSPELQEKARACKGIGELSGLAAAACSAGNEQAYSSCGAGAKERKKAA